MKLTLLVPFIAISFSSLTYADNGIYASVKSGISDTKMKDNRNHYLNDDGDEYSAHIDYYQKNQSKSIYPNISTAIGFDFSKISRINTRLELEYSYKDSTVFSPDTKYEVWDTPSFTGTEIMPNGAKFFKQELKSQSLMFNGYYDFKNKSKFTPYISAGVGLTYLKNNYAYIPAPSQYNFSKTDHDFTWSVGVGTTYNVTDNVALDLSYKYVNTGSFKFSDHYSKFTSEETHFKLDSQDYSLGIRYNF